MKCHCPLGLVFFKELWICVYVCEWGFSVQMDIRRQPWVLVLASHLVWEEIFCGLCCVSQASWPLNFPEFSCLYFLSLCRNAGITDACYYTELSMDSGIQTQVICLVLQVLYLLSGLPSWINFALGGQCFSTFSAVVCLCWFMLKYLQICFAHIVTKAKLISLLLSMILAFVELFSSHSLELSSPKENTGRSPSHGKTVPHTGRPSCTWEGCFSH